MILQRCSFKRAAHEDRPRRRARPRRRWWCRRLDRRLRTPGGDRQGVSHPVSEGYVRCKLARRGVLRVRTPASPVAHGYYAVPPSRSSARSPSISACLEEEAPRHWWLFGAFLTDGGQIWDSHTTPGQRDVFAARRASAQGRSASSPPYEPGRRGWDRAAPCSSPGRRCLPRRRAFPRRRAGVAMCGPVDLSSSGESAMSRRACRAGGRAVYDRPTARLRAVEARRRHNFNRQTNARPASPVLRKSFYEPPWKFSSVFAKTSLDRSVPVRVAPQVVDVECLLYA